MSRRIRDNLFDTGKKKRFASSKQEPRFQWEEPTESVNQGKSFWQTGIPRVQRRRKTIRATQMTPTCDLPYNLVPGAAAVTANELPVKSISSG
jgi:hypothetical protein